MTKTLIDIPIWDVDKARRALSEIGDFVDSKLLGSISSFEAEEQNMILFTRFVIETDGEQEDIDFMMNLLKGTINDTEQY